tara:strand:- start:1594 stop:2529 length:936 start_codon:yes stop_codon:yes gene_type:complete
MTTGKQIPGLNLDALNFPTNITANTISISETQKNLIASGALNIVDHVDPWGRTCKAYAGFKNPHDESIKEIAQIVAQQQQALPDGWGHNDFTQRATVPGNLIGPGQPDRKLTDMEILDILFVIGALKDITWLQNRQSGMCITEYPDPHAQWEVMGKTSTYPNQGVGIPTTAGSPGGVAVPTIGTYLSALSSVNQLATTLGNIPATSSGPCKFMEDMLGALFKAGQVLGEILGKLRQVLGILAMALAIIGLVKLLIDIIKNDLKNLGAFLELLKQAALAGLLEGLMQDPCARYLINSAIATAQTVNNLKTTL